MKSPITKDSSDVQNSLEASPGLKSRSSWLLTGLWSAWGITIGGYPCLHKLHEQERLPSPTPSTVPTSCWPFPLLSLLTLVYPLLAISIFVQSINQDNLLFKISILGTSLMVQWIRCWAPNAGNSGSIPSQETRPHMQLIDPVCCNGDRRSCVPPPRPGAAE